MQNGVSYTPGQLLAVVAPRTVLVVDAPTDWSLAGPLWELALDDAPVDEILDVLVRRGIRSSPSFAIVRVEGEAVRALVRGTVPVCFERTGEPVRLDATGATTWLEGLISGATRVLVGGIEQRTELPYLVDTGVVLVSGLALPTVPAGPTVDEPSGARGSKELGAGPESPATDRRDGAHSIDSGVNVASTAVGTTSVGEGAVVAAVAEHASTSPGPVPREPDRASDGAWSDPGEADDDGSGSPAADASPRVVDLTRSAPRTGSSAVLGAAAAALPAAAPAAALPAAAQNAFTGSTSAPRPEAEPIVPSGDAGDDAGARASRAEATGARPDSLSLIEPEPEVEQPGGLNGQPAPNPFAPFEEPTELTADEPAPHPAAADRPVEAGSTEAGSADLSGVTGPDAEEAADPGAVQARNDEEPDTDARSGFPAPAEFADPAGSPAPGEFSDPSELDVPASDGASDYERERASFGQAPFDAVPFDAVPFDEAPEIADEDTPPPFTPERVSGFGVPPTADAAPSGPSFLGSTGRGAYAPPPWSLSGGAAAAWGVPELSEQAEPSGPSVSDHAFAGEPFADQEPKEPGHRFEASPLNPSQQPDSRAGTQSGSHAVLPVEPPPVHESDELQVDDDDLLINGSARGPLPTALPNFDPPSVSLDLQHLRGRSLFAADARDDQEVEDHHEFEPSGFHDREDENTVVTGAPASTRAADERVEESFEDYVRSRSRSHPDDEPAALPLRVRGQSLPPEHQVPFGGLRSNNGAWPRADRGSAGAEVPEEAAGRPGDGFFDADPENPFIPRPSTLNGVNGHGRSTPDQPDPVPDKPTPGDEPESEGLLLPAFFRGARAARSKTADPVTPDHPAPVWARGNNGNNGNNFGDRPRRGGPLGLRGAGQGGPNLTGAPGPGQLAGGPAAGAPVVGAQGRDGGASLFTPPGGAPPPQAPPREPPRLLGVWCDAGHVTSPDQPECRVCGLRVPPQAPILVARPPLGVLIFDNGDRVEVDRPVVLGRDPKSVPSPDPEAPVLHAVQSRTGQVSRTHAEIRASGWDVVLTDLDAMNGTTLTSPGGTPVAIEPGVPTVITSGSRADLGGESGFVFEVEG